MHQPLTVPMGLFYATRLLHFFLLLIAIRARSLTFYTPTVAVNLVDSISDTVIEP